MPPDAPPSSLRVRAVLRKDRALALDVDFVAPPGITLLLGPSGAGKTTTLDVIAGLSQPTSGAIGLCAETWFDSVAGSMSRSTGDA